MHEQRSGAFDADARNRHQTFRVIVLFHEPVIPLPGLPLAFQGPQPAVPKLQDRFPGQR